MLGFDNEPNNHGDHLGSAYQDGWWGYVSKDLRRVLGQPVSDGFSRTYCGSGSLDAPAATRCARRSPTRSLCRRATLYDEDDGTAGVQRVEQCPAGKSDQWCFDSVRFRPIGAVTVPTIHWINRPTFQQAVEIQGHRNRGYARPAGASPLRVSLVPAYRACSAPDREHGPPLAFGSCNPPEPRSDHLTVGTPDANGNAVASVGMMKFGVFPGNPSTGADEADVNVTFSVTDVRRSSDVADYTGQLQAVATVRITDRDNELTPAEALTPRPCPTSRSRPPCRVPQLPPPQAPRAS